ncbi:HNH endonuclease [Aureimonas leprariae]|nr:HNH endonuclease signature motif containing protein [Aureimonas leprariae]
MQKLRKYFHPVEPWFGGVSASGVEMGRVANLPPMIGAMPNRVLSPPKEAEPFYLSPAWRGLVAEVKQERGNRCEDCGAGGRIIGDHIHERKDGGSDFDTGNIRLRCIPCHNRKTAKAKRARVT